MRKPVTVCAAGCLLLAAYLLLSPAPTQASRAPIDDKVKDALDKIAKSLETGDEAGGKKQAAALAKKLDELNDVMHGFKPRNAKKGVKGIGVGAKPGVVSPDGIEQKVNAIARDGITATELKKEGAAIAEAMWQTAAIAEIAAVKGPEKDSGKKTKAAWSKFVDEMRAGARELATAAKGDSVANVKTAAIKLNNSCNGCHMIFRP
jgi:hypothetical protein